jgi:hypothetical protein
MSGWGQKPLPSLVSSDGLAQIWAPTVFTKNRDRLSQAEAARKFLVELLAHREVRGLLSDGHFSVDGTQVAAWALMKSFKATDGSSDPPEPGRNGEQDFHGEKRSNSTHASTTDSKAQLYRKGPGKQAKLSFMGHALMETPPCSGYAHYTRAGSLQRGVRETGRAEMLRNMGGTPWPPPHTRQPPQGEQCGGRCSGVAPKQTVLDAVGAAAELIQPQREYPLVGELVPQKFAPRSAVERRWFGCRSSPLG